MSLPYLYVTHDQILAMPQTNPFTVVAYNLTSGTIRRIEIETTESHGLTVRWLKNNEVCQEQHVEDPDTQARLIEDLNEQLKTWRADNKYILNVSFESKIPSENIPPKPSVTSQKNQPKIRRDKTNYYLDIAETVASRSTCLRRQYGAIIVKDDQIIATGYNGAPRGITNCSDLGICTRAANHIPHGEKYEQCRVIHAEMNAIISASRTDTIDQTLYLVGLENGQYVENATPCLMCTRVIVNAGIKNVIIRTTKNDYIVLTNEDLVKILN